MQQEIFCWQIMFFESQGPIVYLDLLEAYSTRQSQEKLEELPGVCLESVHKTMSEGV